MTITQTIFQVTAKKEVFVVEFKRLTKGQNVKVSSSLDPRMALEFFFNSLVEPTGKDALDYINLFTKMR